MSEKLKSKSKKARGKKAMDSDKKLYRGPKRTVVVTILLSAGLSMAAANLPSAWGQTKSVKSACPACPLV